MKVLVWNIEKFTEAKFHPKTYVTGNFSKKRKIIDVHEQINYYKMVMTGRKASHRPDVIAILEVLAPTNQDLGELLRWDSSGARGLVTLLKYLKTWTKNDSWRLVPPLKCNPAKPVGTPWAQSEVVGVFYDSSRVTFDGPNQWINNKSQKPGAGQPGGYDVGVNKSFWNKPSITNNTQLAGQVSFYDSSGKEVLFPNKMNRRPFLVDFTEKKGKQRKFRFAFMHTSPGFHTKGTQEIAKIRELTPTGNGAPTICVVGGDFNVNDYKVDESNDAYQPLYNLRFRKMLNPEEHYSTHFFRKKDAKPENWDTYQKKKLIDNFLVWHDTVDAANKAKYAKASVDAVQGFPYPYASTMYIKYDDFYIYSNPIESFRHWENFWHIVSGSDHAPIFLEIK